MAAPEMVTLPRSAIVDAIEALEEAGCLFWACDGPDEPFVSMKTCRVCAAVQDLREILAQAE